jgi:hypothetical protein
MSLNDLDKSLGNDVSAFGWQFTEVATFSKKSSFRIETCFCLSQPKRHEVSNLGRKLRTWTMSFRSTNLDSSSSFGLWPLLINPPLLLFGSDIALVFLLYRFMLLSYRNIRRYLTPSHWTPDGFQPGLHLIAPSFLSTEITLESSARSRELLKTACGRVAERKPDRCTWGLPYGKFSADAKNGVLLGRSCPVWSLFRIRLGRHWFVNQSSPMCNASRKSTEWLYYWMVWRALFWSRARSPFLIWNWSNLL